MYMVDFTFILYTEYLADYHDKEIKNEVKTCKVLYVFTMKHSRMVDIEGRCRIPIAGS